MPTYNTAQECINHLVWSYAAGEVTEIKPSWVSDYHIDGNVTTKKQYGIGVYAYHVNLVKHTVKMRGHVAHYTADDCVSAGGSMKIG